MIPTFNENKTSENFVGKGENAGNQHFLLFTQCFLFVSIPNEIPLFQSHLFCQLLYFQFGRVYEIFHLVKD